MSDAKRLRALEEENAKLKLLLAEAMIDNPVLSLPKGGSEGSAVKKNGSARCGPKTTPKGR